MATEELKNWEVSSILGYFKLALIAAKSKGDIAFALVCNKPVYIMDSRPLEEACSNLISGVSDDIKAAGINSMTADELKGSLIIKQHFNKLVDDLFKYAVDQSTVRVGVKNAPAEEDVEYDTIEPGDPVIALFDVLQNLGLKPQESPKTHPDEPPVIEHSFAEESEEVEPVTDIEASINDVDDDDVLDGSDEEVEEPVDIVEPVEEPEEAVETVEPIEQRKPFYSESGMTDLDTLIEQSELLCRNIRKIAALKKIDAYDNIDDNLLAKLSEDLDRIKESIAEILLDM